MSNEAVEPPPTEAELRAFIGPNAERYLRRWGWSMQHSDRRTRGLWPPVFCNFIWFLYRRMYREIWVPLILALGVGAVQGIVEGLVEGMQGTPWTTPRALEVGTNMGVAFATGWLGSNLYLRKFRKAVNAARQASASPEARLEILGREGGTSTIAAVLGVLAAIGLFVLGAVVEASRAG